MAPALPHYQTGKIKGWSHTWSFAAPIPAWSLARPETGDTAMSVETERPLNGNNPTYLRLSAKTSEGVWLLNEGYWGIGVRSGERYRLSLFARGGSKLKVRVGLVDDRDQPLAACELRLETAGQWKRFSAELAASASCGKARFFLEPLEPGTVDLDFVSLFPSATFKNRPNGCRGDVAQLLADLKPAMETWGSWMEGPFARDLVICSSRFFSESADPCVAAAIRREESQGHDDSPSSQEPFKAACSSAQISKT